MTSLKLPPFEIEKAVGRGGMGAVFLATDSRSGERLALKLLRPEIGHASDVHARFRREMRTVSALDHPNIVRVLEVGQLSVPMAGLFELGLDLPDEQQPTEHGAFERPPGERRADADEPVDLPYIAMEWLPGRDLGELIQEGTDLGRCLAIGSQILDALSAAHQRGLVHRDLKPANVRITPEGEVKLLDFGLVKLLPGSRDLDTTSHLTLDGTVMGTLPYLAPEQLRGEQVGPGADLFAFGVLLYELIAGEPPYPGESMVSYARALLSTTPPRLREKVPDTPPWLDELVQRLISVDPDTRPQDAAQVRALIERYLRRGPAEESSGVEPTRVLLYALGLLGLAAVLVLLTIVR